MIDFETRVWYDVPWLACLAVLLYITLPDTPKGGSVWSKVCMVDWLGLSIGITAVILLVV